MVFQMGVTVVLTWLTSLIVRFLPPSLISSRIFWALFHEIGKLGIFGMFVPSVRVLLGYDG